MQTETLGCAKADIFQTIRGYRDEIHRRVCQQFPTLADGIEVCVTMAVRTKRDRAEIHGTVFHEIIQLNPGGHSCVIGYGNEETIVDNTVQAANVALLEAIAARDRIIGTVKETLAETVTTT